jgi:hypothetical protein
MSAHIFLMAIEEHDDFVLMGTAKLGTAEDEPGWHIWRQRGNRDEYANGTSASVHCWSQRHTYHYTHKEQP